ncbi:MAG TPA: hypothetical protein VF814_06430 [Casimicrobiaceae bacterium]
MTLGEPTSLADDLLARLPGSPDAYPQKIDLNSRMVLLVQFDAGAYRSASFLDDRILGLQTKGAWVPLSRAAEASQLVANARPIHFIFHTGHVGSTLVSRLLDETGEVLSLREPLPLRTLAEAGDALGRSDSLLSNSEFDSTLAMFMRLWSRGYGATRSVVVKATSSAGRLAAPILAANPGSRAIYMNLRAEPYLATLLAGQNSPTDLRGHGPERMRRLHSRMGAAFAPLHTLSIGELAAMSWLAESWTQREAVVRFAGRVIALDFDPFLSTVAESMGRILRHFGLCADARYLAQMERSPVLTRYSKAPEHAYSPSLRAEILSDSRRRNREEIRKGMAWLEQQARSDPSVAEMVNGAGGSSRPHA